MSYAWSYPARLNMGLEVSVDYDDNIYFAPESSEISDLLTRIRPSLNYIREWRAFKLKTSYQGDYFLYAANENLHDYYHKGSVAFITSFFESLRLNLSFEYHPQPILFSGPDDGSINLTQSVHPGAQLVWSPRLWKGAHLESTPFIKRAIYFDKNSQQVGYDFTEYGVDTSLFQKLSSVFEVFLQGGYRSKEYIDDRDGIGLLLPDFTSTQAGGGLSIKHHQIHFLGYTGITWVDFDGLKNKETTAYSLELKWYPFKRIDVGTVWNQFFTQDVTGTSFDANYFQLNFTYRLNKRLVAETAFTWRHLKPLGNDATERLTEQLLVLRYHIQPTQSVALHYRHSQNGDDDFRLTDYSNNRVGLLFSFSY